MEKSLVQVGFYENQGKKFYYFSSEKSSKIIFKEEHMEFNCKVNVIDMVMGSGKTSAAINYINETNQENERIIYITPYLSEIKRIKEACISKKFKEPEIYGTKLDGIKYLIQNGENIVSTHALFHRFDKEIVDMCRSQNYTLIMDEVTDVIEQYQITQQDIDTLISKYAYVDEKTNLIKWREEEMNYTGKFMDEKRLCEFNCLAYYGKSVMIWLFPIDVFNAFRNVYILTYLFKAQMQCYYYDFYKLPYKYLYVEGDSVDNYRFTDMPVCEQKHNYRELIHICENNKLNMIGDMKSDLSKSWYGRNENNIVMTNLKHNIYNFFNNIRHTPSNLNLWTTFKEYRQYLQGKGYSKSYLSHNARATNEYKNRISVAYTINKYMNPYVKKFFETNDVPVNEDGFATSEMLQFIWRSAIREGNEIWLYIPSIRMRTLLYKWIDENTEKE